MNELKKFTNLIDKILRIPHTEIKEKLESEKARKAAKKKEKKVDA